jgi:hypothetical protein
LARADEISACNGDLVVTIIEFIIEHTILTKIHLISPKNLFGLNPNQLEKTTGKRMGPLSFLSMADAPERKNERAPRRDGSEEQAFRR